MRKRMHGRCFRKRLAKADSTQRSSQAVPHPSTNRALCCLTSEVKRDPVHSTRYGRQRNVNISTRLVLGIVESYEVVCACATTRLWVHVLSVALVVAFDRIWYMRCVGCLYSYDFRVCFARSAARPRGSASCVPCCIRSSSASFWGVQFP
jgi:hypothetical protein